jgi:hypothetical protein
MKNKRIVCMVVEKDNGMFDAIAGDEVTERLNLALKAYMFTPDGIASFISMLIGNEEIPINTTAERDELA